MAIERPVQALGALTRKIGRSGRPDLLFQKQRMPALMILVTGLRGPQPFPSDSLLPVEWPR